MKSLFPEGNVNIPEAALDLARRIRPKYFESSFIKCCQGNVLGSLHSGKEQSFIERKRS